MFKKIFRICSVALILAGGIEFDTYGMKAARATATSPESEVNAKVNVVLDVEFNGKAYRLNLLDNENKPTNEDERTIEFELKTNAGNNKLRLTGSNGLSYKADHWEMEMKDHADKTLSVKFDFYDGASSKFEDIKDEQDISGAAVGNCKIVAEAVGLQDDTPEGEYYGKLQIEITGA